MCSIGVLMAPATWVARPSMKRLLVFYTAIVLLSACATMTKPGMTPQSKAQDRYDCERQVYDSHATGALVQNAMYRDCMRAPGLPLSTSWHQKGTCALLVGT
jgi:hypothetical protein